MAFRDETEALRARIDVLERELAEQEALAEEGEAARRELIVLKARVADLERRLDAKKPIRRAARWVLFGAGLAAALAGAAWVYVSGSSVEPNAAPTRGMLDLGAHPTPPALSSVTAGVHEASELGSGCLGFVPDAPLLVLRTERSVNVRLWTQSNADLVMLVRSDRGEVRCDDDSGVNFNPQVATQLGPGDHRVWIGTYEEDERADFTLHVETEVDLDDAGLAIDEPPTLADITPRDALWGRAMSGSTTGEVPAQNARPGCPGHVPLRPHLRLHLEEPRHVRVGAHSGQDLVLLVQRPDGSFLCDDDGGEDLDPALDERLDAGTYHLWVGTYQVAEAADFDLTIDAARPLPVADEARPPRLGRWDLTEEPLLSFTGQVVPSAPVQTTQPGCRDGWGFGGRDLELVLDSPRTVSLDLQGAGPVSLLIEHPDGTQTCTHAEGLAPTHFAAGSHRVWLSIPQTAQTAPFTLVAHAHPE